MNTLELLQAARELIADKDHWHQGNEAIDEYGDYTNPGGKRAAAWCATGALMRFTKGKVTYAKATQALCDTPVMQKFLTVTDPEEVEALGEGDYGKLATFNDSVTHRTVLTMYDQAIKQLSK